MQAAGGQSDSLGDGGRDPGVGEPGVELGEGVRGEVVEMEGTDLELGGAGGRSGGVGGVGGIGAGGEDEFRGGRGRVEGHSWVELGVGFGSEVAEEWEKRETSGH